MYYIEMSKLHSGQPKPPLYKMSYEMAYKWIQSQSYGNQIYYNIKPCY